MEYRRHHLKKTYSAARKAALLLAAAVVIFCTAAGPVSAAQSYTINGVTLPLEEKGYKDGDYRGAGLCWQFARHIYYNIWGCFFYLDRGGYDDMLRDYPDGESRRITTENARLFISAAPAGSVIRLQSVLEGPDSTESNRHSLILLDKTESGCTLYHDWKGYATITTCTWAQFVEQFRYEVDFGYFKYIKYPGAKALKYDYSPQEMSKELVISSRIYGSAELSLKKR